MMIISPSFLGDTPHPQSLCSIKKGEINYEFSGSK